MDKAKLSIRLSFSVAQQFFLFINQLFYALGWLENVKPSIICLFWWEIDSVFARTSCNIILGDFISVLTTNVEIEVDISQSTIFTIKFGISTISLLDSTSNGFDIIGIAN